ncbi:unnamed protein product, partial [Gongylonema pulchrum]|uniref:Secreted protein n=1 Tax=Gongylonema pulchrum TaxID=637853 RepID=A0A183DP35_9BILA
MPLQIKVEAILFRLAAAFAEVSCIIGAFNGLIVGDGMLNGIGNVYYPFVGVPPPLLPPPPPAAPIWGPLLGIPFGQRIFLRTPWI